MTVAQTRAARRRWHADGRYKAKAKPGRGTSTSTKLQPKPKKGKQ